MTEPHSLDELLTRLSGSEDAGHDISVRDILGRIGDRSFGPVLLVPSLLMVSPLSAIPGSPTINALIIILITAQWLAGRPHLWLPDVLMRRKVSAAALARAVAFLRRPARWMDGISRDRLRFLTVRPFSTLSKLVIICIALTWPLLEILPMVTSIGAATISLFAFGIVMRDGLFVIAGCVALAGIGAAANWIIG